MAKKKATKPQKRQTKKDRFLAEYAKVGNLSQAARMARVDRKTHYRWLENDPEYPARFEAAHAKACDAIDEEIRRRGIEGWDEPVWHKGELVGRVRKYSDTLLIFYAKGAMPEKYRENHKFDLSRNLKHEHLHDIPDETLAQIAAQALAGGSGEGAAPAS